MKKLAEEIYSLLSSVGDTYHNILPADPVTTGLLIVYELNEAGSSNTLDTKDYANDVDLVIKLLHPDSLNLLGVAGDVKGLLLNHPYENARDVNYGGSVPIFWDAELQTNQYTLNFSLYSDGSRAGMWTYIKATLQAIKDRFLQYYTKQEVEEYVATNAPAPDLTGYATELYVQQSLPDLNPYATIQYVDENTQEPIWTGTQAEHDAIVKPVDDTTIYLIL